MNLTDDQMLEVETIIGSGFKAIHMTTLYSWTFSGMGWRLSLAAERGLDKHGVQWSAEIVNEGNLSWSFLRALGDRLETAAVRLRSFATPVVLPETKPVPTEGREAVHQQVLTEAARRRRLHGTTIRDRNPGRGRRDPDRASKQPERSAHLPNQG